LQEARPDAGGCGCAQRIGAHALLNKQLDAAETEARLRFNSIETAPKRGG
jgi:hypothetical protein